MLALKKSARMVADLVFLIVMVTTTMPTIIQGLPQLDISGLVGQTIRLPCNVDMEKCGNLHSIKWYRGSSRIFVFSEMAKIARSEGDYVERAELHYTPNSTVSELEVKQLQVADEAVYKCEITYIEVREGCAVVQFINLTALIKPEYVKVTKGDGTELTNATLIGPYTEGDELTLVCESGGGKPIPSVSWWNGTHKMAGEYTAESGPNSVGTGRNRVHMTLGRGDLGAKYECRAENAALNAPIVSNIRVEVNVRPLKLELSGLEHHVVQGTIVVLKCDVIGARPKANITWYNGTKALPEGGPIVTSYDLQLPRTIVVEDEDGTSSTQSRLEFTASRFENGGLLMCEGSNPVMTSRDEKPLRDTINLEVLYPPIVTLSPENVTVDEGQDFHLYLEYQSNPAALKVVRWYREGIEVVSSSDHYEGGTTDFYNLSIRNSTRYDQGVYTVVLENEVGASEPNDAIYVSIYFKPTVSLTMETSTLTPTPVRELDRMNITLVCRVEQGNPDLLIGVRWYLGGELLKELPDCEGGNATSPASAASDLTFCDIDPSRLLLENVGRGFHGNYSCEGRNEAGWGPLSQDQELVVYYPPGPSTLVYEPREVVKKGTVTLRCTVEEPGYPETSTFKWMRGTHHIPNVTSASLTNPVTLETESNFTCLAYNEGGEGEPATIYIDVLAPPAFIGRLPLYHGALVTAQNVSVSCRVECSPLCAVHWLKNGQHLGDTSRAGSQYRVNNTVLPPDTRSGDFESTLSTLVWNMAAWPGGRLDRIHDNDNYTCQSDDNIAGPGVRSSTIFRVEYPPENITVSNKRVNVTETDVPEWVICNAKAYPEAMYQWYKDGERNTTVLKGGNTLILSGPLKKERGGNYTCEAFNRHGNITQKTFINVLYKPQCGITQSDQDGKLVLVCTADANPTDVDFTWRIKNENDTIEENIEKRGLQSFLTLDTYVETFRTYLCFANNSVGMSIPCERDVTGHLGWWRMENENMIIVVAVVIGGIIMVLIICVIIIIVCRRKRADDKYPNPSTTKDKSKPDLVSSPSDGMLQPDGDKAFYENLPFHGMQSAPNKPITPSLSSKHQHHHHTLVSRPSSQLSHNGSSGYGSTRSHVGPHQSGAALSANRCQSLSRVHTRRRGHISGHFPQFYSLRLHKRHRDKSPKDNNKHPNKSVPKEERVFELHAMPIKESSPEGKSSLQGNEMNNNEEDRKGNNPDIAEEKELGLSQLSLSPPVPAPRKQSPNKAVKHTYQNVPIPITPNSQELTSFQNQHHHHHHYQHHHYNFTSSQHHLLTPPSNNHPYPVGSLKRSSVANRTHLPRPPVRLEYQQPFHVTDSVVYADLALVNGRREPHYPPYYRPPPPQQAPTEYAILKFHDVGQEIDV